MILRHFQRRKVLGRWNLSATIFVVWFKDNMIQVQPCGPNSYWLYEFWSTFDHLRKIFLCGNISYPLIFFFLRKSLIIFLTQLFFNPQNWVKNTAPIYDDFLFFISQFSVNFFNYWRKKFLFLNVENKLSIFISSLWYYIEVIQLSFFFGLL